MKFGCYLLHTLNKKNKSQTKLVCELQLNFDIFSSLDEITLSRWVHNKTTPSLEKQLLIAHHLEGDIINFISSIEKQKIKKSLMTSFNNTFKIIENSYHNISYHSLLKGNKDLSLINMNQETHRTLLGDFYKQFEMYENLFSYMNTNKLDIKTTVLAIKKNDEIVSHISFNQNAEKYIPCMTKTKKNHINTNSISINIGYYSTKEHYNILTGNLFCHLADNFMSVKKVYVISNGEYFNEFLEGLGGEIVILKKESKKIWDTYVFKFDFIKLLSNPFIFNQIKDNYLSYLTLKENLTLKI